MQFGSIYELQTHETQTLQAYSLLHHESADLLTGSFYV